MFLSIIIPTYNCGKYINDCIESIKKVAGNDIEVIIIDDGSTDDTKTIIKKYENNNYKYFKNKNNGVSYSRNFGIKNAKGKYIMFVDADDVLEENWYPIIKKIKSENYDIIYFSNYYDVDKIKQKDIIENIIGYPTVNNLGNLSSVCSKLYKRDFLLTNNIRFEEEIVNGEDLLFNLKSIFFTQNIKFIKESFYRYRINCDSATHNFNDYIFDSNSKFIKKMCNYFNDLSSYSVNNYYTFCMFNSIYIFLYRISLIKNKAERKSKYYIFKKNEYKVFLKKYKFRYEYGLIKNIFIYFVKFNFIDIAIFFMKIKISMQNNKIKQGLWEEV